MLPFLFFLVFLLYDVQLVIPDYGVVLYRSRSGSDALQILLYCSGTGYCICIRCPSHTVWAF